MSEQQVSPVKGGGIYLPILWHMFSISLSTLSTLEKVFREYFIIGTAI